MCEVDEDKLKDLLRDYQVRISNRGKICLNDFVAKVIESKNPEQYIKRLKYEKFTINDRIYIEPNDCYDLIQITNKKNCKIIYEQLERDDKDTSNIVDVEDEIFQFEGYKFKAFFVKMQNGDWGVWIRGSDAARYLGYANDKQAIREHVDDDNKLPYGKLLKLFPMLSESTPKSLDKNTNFINIPGFMNLIHISKKPLAKKIKRWLDNEVVLSLVKYGVYVMQPKNLKITKFYDSNTFHKFDKVPVVYIAFVGKYEGIYVFKYGISRDMFRREYKEHRKQFTKFDVVFIEECQNCEVVEDLFEKDMKLRNLHREIVINKKKQTELFAVTTQYTYEHAIQYVQQLIKDNPIQDIKNANNEISKLNSVVDILKDSQIVATLDKEVQKLAYEFKISPNYKLELETSLKIAELQSETQISLKDKDLEIEKIRLRRAEIKKGIKPSISVRHSYVPKKSSRREIVVL